MKLKKKINGKQDGEPQQKLLTSIKEEITNLFAWFFFNQFFKIFFENKK